MPLLQKTGCPLSFFKQISISVRRSFPPSLFAFPLLPDNWVRWKRLLDLYRGRCGNANLQISSSFFFFLSLSTIKFFAPTSHNSVVAFLNKKMLRKSPIISPVPLFLPLPNLPLLITHTAPHQFVASSITCQFLFTDILVTQNFVFPYQPFAPTCPPI